MENATKALLIAAAVLIAILLISFGVLIINNTKDIITNTDGLDALELQQYNQQFLNYQGDYVSGSKIKGLMSLVQNHNRTNASDESRQVKIMLGGEDITTNSSKISAGYSYKVEFEYNSGNLIDTIKLTSNQAQK